MKPSISIVVDSKESWMNKYVFLLVNSLRSKGYKVKFCSSYHEIPYDGISFFLSCINMCPKAILKRSIHNLVVHQSDLPKGRGWSPTTWQVLEGKNIIPVTLIEATDKVDSGKFYYKSTIILEGHELVDEIRKKQADNAFEMVKRFLEDYPNNKQIKQNGRETFYKRRTSEDSELSIGKTIKAQFNLLRVCDNQRYPAFFKMNGYKYVIKIEKVE